AGGGVVASSGKAKFALRKAGARWFARRKDVGGEEFLAGVVVDQPAKNYHGLHFPVAAYYGPTFDAAEHEAAIGPWAYLLEVSVACESKGRFNLINTYDRARFTYGFYQLAAHTPGDNLILYFREAMALPQFRALFPDLELRGGRLVQVTPGGGTVNLEAVTHDAATGEDQLQNFMAYLNPTRASVDETEVLNAAKLVWWANERPEGNALQARVAAQILKGKVNRRYNGWYDLDGRSDVVCAIVADIHHQGRAKRDAVAKALKAAVPETALLKLGEGDYGERIATLRARIAHWKSAGRMGKKRYDAASNAFV
ncbi:MAG TPA: hypothetical protein VIO94_05535, partial [Phenylobacterium sp.]